MSLPDPNLPLKIIKLLMRRDLVRGLVYAVGGAWAASNPAEAERIIALTLLLSGGLHVIFGGADAKSPG